MTYEEARDAIKLFKFSSNPTWHKEKLNLLEKLKDCKDLASAMSMNLEFRELNLNKTKLSKSEQAELQKLKENFRSLKDKSKNLVYRIYDSRDVSELYDLLKELKTFHKTKFDQLTEKTNSFWFLGKEKMTQLSLYILLNNKESL